MAEEGKKYPWDKCIKDMSKQYPGASKERLSKICASIARKSGRANKVKAREAEDPRAIIEHLLIERGHTSPKEASTLVLLDLSQTPDFMDDPYLNVLLKELKTRRID